MGIWAKQPFSISYHPERKHEIHKKEQPNSKVMVILKNKNNSINGENFNFNFDWKT